MTQRNSELEVLLTEAGYSHAALARQIKLLGQREHGLDLRYDYRAVRRWLVGAVPEAPTPALIATIFTRALGRPIGCEQLGFNSAASVRRSLLLPISPSTSVETVVELWRAAVVDRRKFLAQAAFTGVAALEAVIDWRFSPPSAAPAQAAGTVTVHEGDVERLRRARVEFADLDHAHGGGHALGWLQQYLHQEVAPLLQGRYRDKIGRNLFLAAATLSNVAGWMAMDAGQHGLGQRHYTQAIALAKHAGADAFAACASGNLATQALFLGQTQTAIRLTRAALDSSTSLPAALIAQIATTEARAHALTGDAYETMRLLREADEAMTRAQPEADPEWLAPWTEAHHAGGAMHALRDLGRVAEAQQRASDALAAPSGNVRTRALHQVLQASVLARSGELDGACETATEVRNSAAGLRSKRLNQRLAELMELLDEHQDVGVVRDFFAASR